MVVCFSRVTGDKKKNGIIRKYGLNMSRQAFREKAEDIGFKKVSKKDYFFFSPSFPILLEMIGRGHCRLIWWFIVSVERVTLCSGM